eukprot:gene11825-24790_t
METSLCIIGAGAIGLTTAIEILDTFQSENPISVTIIAEKLYDETTTFGCGGLVAPYQIFGTPEVVVDKWTKASYDFFHKLWYSADAGRAGVQLVTAHQLFENEAEFKIPSWSNAVINFKILDSDMLCKMGLPPQFVIGYSYETYVVDQKYYLKYQMELLTSKGVRFVRRRLASLDELLMDGEYDVVVNCSGIGAYELLSDHEVHPIRGQVLRVHAPWIKRAYFYGTSYLIPNVDTVVVGGTAQKGDWNTSVSDEDTETILEKACQLFPSLRGAKVVNVWAGLRPGRTSVRLDSEMVVHTLGGTQGGWETETLVVHCYGHGGSGVTLSVGCAQEVVRDHIMTRILDTNNV